MRRRVVWYRVLALLVIVICTFAVSLALFLSFQGIEPKDFISRIRDMIVTELPPGLDDPLGSKWISPQEVEYYYVKNRLEGYLLVLTGGVRNMYPTARLCVRVKALLLDDQGRTLTERTVYAGWALTRDELERLSMLRIAAFLSQEDVRTAVAPGRNLPFMIVFDHIPRNRCRFTIEPAGSFPAKMVAE